MWAKNITLVLVLISFCVCVHSGVLIEGNTTKSEVEKSSCYCSGVNQVCIDGWCYCAPNYKKNAYGTCVYSGCTYDFDCVKTQDWNRHCFGASCVCDSSYTEDWNNGRKCTYTYHVSVWAWVWVFFVIPGIIIFVCVLRRRRFILSHSHVTHCPPPTHVHTMPYQPQVVTVYQH